MKDMKRNILKIVALVLVVTANACKEESNAPLYGVGPAPSVVTNVVATPAPGGADITYSLPDDADLLYVEADVVTPLGRAFTVKSSSYSNVINIRGLADTEPQDVTLYSVNKGGARSEGYTLTINPLTPPYMEVYNSLRVKEDFGGVNMAFQNEYNASLAVVLSYIDERDGEYIEYDTYYTDASDVNYSFRGLESKPYKFGFYIRDRWDNMSPMLEDELTPLYEEELDKSRFNAVTGIMGDGWNSNRTGFGYGEYFSDVPENKITNLWDNRSPTSLTGYGAEVGYQWLYIQKSSSGEKAAFTFDLGQTTQISRLRFNQYQPWSAMSPKEFEIYGRADLNTQVYDGSWEHWTLLATVNNEKPSGLAGNEYGPGDAEAYANGINVNIDLSAPRVRYIRVKCVESWQGNNDMAFCEVTVWGDPR